MMRFRDHHIFDIADLKDIKSEFEKIDGAHKIILTTEKDGVRLFKFEEELKDYPVYVFPIKHKFLFGDDENFEKVIRDYISLYKKTWQ